MLYCYGIANPTVLNQQVMWKPIEMKCLCNVLILDLWFSVHGSVILTFEWKRLVLFPIIFCIGKEITIFSPNCGLFFRHIHWISDMRLCINAKKIVDYGFYPTAHYSISLCLCRLHQHAHLWSFLNANKWIKWKKNKNQNKGNKILISKSHLSLLCSV